MDDKKLFRENHYGINFAPIGKAIEKARVEKRITRESIAETVDYSVRGRKIFCVYGENLL